MVAGSMESRAAGGTFWTRLPAYLGILFFTLVVLVPFWWIVNMSFKTYEQIQFATSIYFPAPFTLQNYETLLFNSKFPLWFRNSFVVGVVVTLLTVAVGSLGGYALARLKFPGRQFMASSVLILYLVPPALLFIPLYRVLNELGTINSLTSLVLAYPTFTVPFAIWLLIGFFKSIPYELEEAALIDGASRPQTFARIILPLAGPGILAAAIFAFTLSWNEFLYALIFVQDESLMTIPVGLNLLIYGEVFLWGMLMAASVLTTAPIVLLYTYLQRWMVQGLTAGAVKG